MLDRLVPCSWACRPFGKEHQCEFVQICHREQGWQDPLGGGHYIARRPHHEAELQTNAAGLILAHNHPSGDPTPSPDDRMLVSRLRQVGDILGAELLDTLIVTDPMDGGAYSSFREAGGL